MVDPPETIQVRRDVATDLQKLVDGLRAQLLTSPALRTVLAPEIKQTLANLARI